MALEIEINGNDTTRELAKTVIDAFKEKPDKKALAEFRALAERLPAQAANFFDLSAMVTAGLIKKIAPTPGATVALTAKVKTLQSGLGYEQASQLEKMLIENIMNAWLRYQWTEYQVAELIGTNSSYEHSRHWDRKLTEAQKRYLRAVETLAKIRKLALPALQVNINTDRGQQVNIAGDLVKG